MCDFGDVPLVSSAELEITGINPDKFSVTGQPQTPVIPTGNQSFTIMFDPFFDGSYSAIVTIKNNDPDEGLFYFTVTGDAYPYP